MNAWSARKRKADRSLQGYWRCSAWCVCVLFRASDQTFFKKKALPVVSDGQGALNARTKDVAAGQPDA